MRAFATRYVLFPILICAAAGAATPAKKTGSAAAKTGIQTPGIQIAMTELKTEADIELPGPAEVLASADAIYAASPAKGTLVRVDPKANKVEALSGVTKPCGAIVSAFNSLWVSDCKEQALIRIDSKTKKVTAKIGMPIPDSGALLAASEDSIWVLADAKSTLIRIDPGENKPVAELRLPDGCSSLAFGETALWVTCPKNDKLLKINPRTNLVDKRIEIAGKPFAVAIGESSVWVLSAKEGKVARVDPKADKVTATVELNIPDAKGAMTFGEGYLWVSLPGFPLTRIDPSNDKVAQQFTGGAGAVLVASNGAVWLGDPAATTLKRIDVKRIKATLAP